MRKEVITLIHITEKQTGKILDYIPLGDFWDDNHHKSLKDTLEYFEFRTFGDKRYSEHLEKMNRIIIPDEDGTFIEFVIFHAIKYRLQNTIVVDVYAPSSYLLLKKAKVIKPQKLEGYTAAQHADFALAGTEWEVGRVDYAGIRTITIESHTNPYAYLKRIASEFDLELHFRVEVDGNKVIGRYVDLLERVGEWQGREVEFGRDLLGIERKVDDSNVVTALIGLGPERDDGTRLEVFVEDEEALQRWGIPNPQTGELMHLIETYEPESTNQDMTIERLTELTRNELEKRINSVVEYTADVADLEKVPGMENKIIRFGDTIKIKDTGFNPPLYLEARVHTQDRSLSQPEKKKVTLGDYIEYTEEEVHAIWKQLQAEIAKKVTLAQVTEVVYTKPEVDARDDAVREHADNVAESAKREAIQIAAEDASQKAKQAEDNAKGYTDDRLQNTVAKDIFENTVTDLLNNIAQKVDSTRFEQVESELRGIAEGLRHEVAEHADMLEEHGGKITKLETDVDEVEGKINATISELEALGDTVSRHETQIDANAREIALKADKQELDLLSGTVSGINSELSVMAGKIEAKAERSEVEKLESDVSKVSQDVSKLTIDVDGVKTNVSSISQTVSDHGTQISNINSTLTQHANMIASKVEKSEFDSVTNTLGNRISTIEQTADSISLEVSNIKANVYTKSEVDSAIDGIQVGGRNLLKSSRLIRPYSNDNSKYPISRSLITEGERQFYRIVRTNTQSYPTTMSLYNSIPVTDITQDLQGQTVTFSFRARASHNVSSSLFFYFDGGSNGRKNLSYHGSTFQITTSWKTFAFTVSIDFSIYNSDVLRFTPWQITIPSGEIDNFYLDLCEFKIELGNKATDWTPAPEDIDAQISDIEGTLASHSTKIEQNAQQIQLRATKAEVDTLSGRVSTVESTIQQHADMIATKVSRTEFESLQIGGRNLLTNSDFSKTYKGNPFTVDGKTYDTYPYQWGGYNSGIDNPTANYHAHIDDDTFGFNVVEYNETNGQRNWKGIHQSGLEKRLSPTQTGIFTFSVDVYATGTGTRLFGGFYYFRKSDGKRAFHSGQFNIEPTEVNKWVRMSAQCRLNDDVDFSQTISFYIYGYNFTTNSILYIKNVKLEYGNKATDWTSAPEDVQEQIDGLGSRLSTAETSITQLAGQIELRATKTEVDALSGRVSTVESTIQQHADLIESKIDDGQARSIFRQEASSFTFEADQINFKGHVFGEDATFTGRLEGATIIGSSFYARDPNEREHPNSIEIDHSTFLRTFNNKANKTVTETSISDSFSITLYNYSGFYGPGTQLEGAVDLAPAVLRLYFRNQGETVYGLNRITFESHFPYTQRDEFIFSMNKARFTGSVIISSFTNPLWTGALYLSDAHTIIPAKPISECMTGWILRWQAYNPGEGVEQTNFQYTHIPKVTLQAEGRGHRVLLMRLNTLVTKYFYIYDDYIVGHVNNAQGDNRNLVLTGVFEY